MSHSSSPWIIVSKRGLVGMLLLPSHAFISSVTRICYSSAIHRMSRCPNWQALGYKEASNLSSNPGTEPGLELKFGASSQCRNCHLGLQGNLWITALHRNLVAWEVGRKGEESKTVSWTLMAMRELRVCSVLISSRWQTQVSRTT